MQKKKSRKNFKNAKKKLKTFENARKILGKISKKTKKHSKMQKTTKIMGKVQQTFLEKFKKQFQETIAKNTTIIPEKIQKKEKTQQIWYLFVSNCLQVFVIYFPVLVDFESFL